MERERDALRPKRREREREKERSTRELSSSLGPSVQPTDRLTDVAAATVVNVPVAPYQTDLTWPSSISV